MKFCTKRTGEANRPKRPQRSSGGQENEYVAKQESCEEDGVEDETRDKQSPDLRESLKHIDVYILHRGVFAILVFFDQSHPG